MIIHHILSFPFIHIFIENIFDCCDLVVINSDHCIYSHIHIAFDSLILTHFDIERMRPNFHLDKYEIYDDTVNSLSKSTTIKQTRQIIK